MLIEAGATPKDVAARLGHKDATITQNLYTHDTEKMQRETVALFVKSIEKSMQTSPNADKMQTSSPRIGKANQRLFILYII